MAQRVLEPGQIESLAQRSIPRVRLPETRLFERRAARLRTLASASPMGAYLELLACLAAAQSRAVRGVSLGPLDESHLQRSAEHGMPPLPAVDWAIPSAWHLTLREMGAPIGADRRFPPEVAQVLARIESSGSAWRERQARAVLDPQRREDLDPAAAPFIAAALQVHFIAAASRLDVRQVQPLDAHGVCPLCGSLPVVSMVYAHSPYQGYRYLHCGVCATEWHMVRVQCTVCGAVGKDIAYHTLEGAASGNDGTRELPAVRAETCEHCESYRKILYEEQDAAVEALADDLATLTLDMLLGERGYRRASVNPLLWTAEPR